MDLADSDAWLQAGEVGDHLCDDAGYSVAGVGDTNGDGYDDVLIGAPGYFTYTETWDGERSGMAGLFLGPVSGLDHMQNADASWYYGGYAARTGYDVAGAGDVDGDGLSDILIGAPGDDTYAAEAGAAYLILAAGL